MRRRRRRPGSGEPTGPSASWSTPSGPNWWARWCGRWPPATRAASPPATPSTIWSETAWEWRVTGSARWGAASCRSRSRPAASSVSGSGCHAGSAPGARAGGPPPAGLGGAVALPLARVGGRADRDGASRRPDHRGRAGSRAHPACRVAVLAPLSAAGGAERRLRRGARGHGRLPVHPADLRGGAPVPVRRGLLVAVLADELGQRAGAAGGIAPAGAVLVPAGLAAAGLPRRPGGRPAGHGRGRGDRPRARRRPGGGHGAGVLRREWFRRRDVLAEPRAVSARDRPIGAGHLGG